MPTSRERENQKVEFICYMVESIYDALEDHLRLDDATVQRFAHDLPSVITWVVPYINNIPGDTAVSRSF